jgi:hypothetical protein
MLGQLQGGLKVLHNVFLCLFPSLYCHILWGSPRRGWAILICTLRRLLVFIHCFVSSYRLSFDITPHHSFVFIRAIARSYPLPCIRVCVSTPSHSQVFAVSSSASRPFHTHERIPVIHPGASVRANEPPRGSFASPTALCHITLHARQTPVP